MAGIVVTDPTTGEGGFVNGGGIAPTTVIDPTTRSVVATQAPAVPELAPAAPVALSGKTVVMYSPNGTPGMVPVEKADAAAAAGFRAETPTERDVREYLKANEGATGAAKVFFRGLADEAAFGVLDPVIDHTSDPMARARWEALKNENAAANVVGRGIGFLGSMFYGGEFAKGAQVAGHVAERAVLGAGEHAVAKKLTTETYRALATAVETKMLTAGVPAAEAAAHAPGFARLMAANAAKYGAENVAWVMPKALTEAALGDPDQAGETIVSALGAGAILGIGGHLAGAGFRAITKGASSGALSAKLREFGDEQAISALDMTKPIAKKLRRVNGMEEAIAITKEAKLAEHAGDAPAMAEKISHLWDEAGQEIAKIRRAAGNGEVVGIEDAFNSILAPAKAAQKGMGSRGAGESVERWANDEILRPLAERWVDSAGAKKGLTIEELHEIRRTVDKATKWDATVPVPVNELRKEIRSAVNEMLEKKLEQAGDTMGKELLPAWKAANRRYQVLSVMKENALNNLDRNMANRRHSITDYAGNMLGGFVGNAIGGPVGSIVGGVAGGEINNALRRLAPAYLAQGAHGAADMVDRGGLVWAEQAMKRTAERLDEMPKALAGKAALKDTFTTNVLSRFADADPSFGKATKGEQVALLADRLASLHGNPAEQAEHIKQIIAPLAEDAPAVAAATGAQVSKVLAYLHEKAPKRPDPDSPFAKPSKWTPSPREVSEFSQILAVVHDPAGAGKHFRSLTPVQVDTLKTLYPKIYEMKIQKTVEAGANKPVLTYSDRLALGRVVPGIEPNVSNTAAYQSNFAQPEAAQQGKPSGKPMKPPSLETTAQRIAQR